MISIIFAAYPKNLLHSVTLIVEMGEGLRLLVFKISVSLSCGFKGYNIVRFG